MMSLFANLLRSPRKSLRPAAVALPDREDTSRDVLKNSHSDEHPNECVCAVNLQRLPTPLSEFMRLLFAMASATPMPLLAIDFAVLPRRASWLRGSWQCIRHGSIPLPKASRFPALFQAVFSRFFQHCAGLITGFRRMRRSKRGQFQPDHCAQRPHSFRSW